jgi:hypothetical protein
VFLFLATSKASTMPKELRAAGEPGLRLFGATVSKTAFSGGKIVCILGKRAN